jgi:hypothetical protein
LQESNARNHVYASGAPVRPVRRGLTRLDRFRRFLHDHYECTGGPLPVVLCKAAVADGLACRSAGRQRAVMAPALTAWDGPRWRSKADRGFLGGLATAKFDLFDVVLGFFSPVWVLPPLTLDSFQGSRLRPRAGSGWRVRPSSLNYPALATSPAAGLAPCFVGDHPRVHSSRAPVLPHSSLRAGLRPQSTSLKRIKCERGENPDGGEKPQNYIKQVEFCCRQTT